MRGASYAYAVEDAVDLFEQSGPATSDSGPVRLLGINGKSYAGPVASMPPQFAQHPTHPYSPPTARYALPASMMEYSVMDEQVPYYAYGEDMSEAESSTSRVRGRMGRILAAGLLGIAALSALVVVAPALARGGSSGLRLSGYREAAVAGVAGANAQDGAPVIDATSGQTTSGHAQSPQAAAQAGVASAASAYALEGPPTMSVRQIEAVLAQYGSPAAGSGQKLYDLGLKYGINPAFALAFFVHESGGGTKGVARFTKSLGNIRWTAGFDNYEGYRSYPTWEAGMEDWYVLIKNLYIQGWGLRTVDAIIPTYAPSADRNDPATYIASVKQMVDSWRGK